MADVFTQKEMMIRLMDKFDSFEKNMDNKVLSITTNFDNKILPITTKLNETHELASNTNGKVKLHTKLIFGLGGVLTTSLIAIVGWIFLLK